MATKKYINTADVVELTGCSTSEVQELAKTMKHRDRLVFNEEEKYSDR